MTDAPFKVTAEDLQEFKDTFGLSTKDLPAPLRPFADSVNRLLLPIITSQISIQRQLAELHRMLGGGRAAAAGGAGEPAAPVGDAGLTVPKVIEALGAFSKENIDRLKAILKAGENATRAEIEKQLGRGNTFEWRGFQTAITRRFRVVLNEPGLSFFQWSAAPDPSLSRLTLGEHVRTLLQEGIDAYERGETGSVQLHRRGQPAPGVGVSLASLAPPPAAAPGGGAKGGPKSGPAAKKK